MAVVGVNVSVNRCLKLLYLLFVMKLYKYYK